MIFGRVDNLKIVYFHFQGINQKSDGLITQLL